MWALCGCPHYDSACLSGFTLLNTRLRDYQAASGVIERRIRNEWDFFSSVGIEIRFKGALNRQYIGFS